MLNYDSAGLRRALGSSQRQHESDVATYTAAANSRATEDERLLAVHQQELQSYGSELRYARAAAEALAYHRSVDEINMAGLRQEFSETRGSELDMLNHAESHLCRLHAQFSTHSEQQAEEFKAEAGTYVSIHNEELAYLSQVEGALHARAQGANPQLQNKRVRSRGKFLHLLAARAHPERSVNRVHVQSGRIRSLQSCDLKVYPLRPCHVSLCLTVSPFI